MRFVYMLPTLETARQNETNSICQIVVQLAKHLPAHGYTLTDDPTKADLVAGHAGQMGEDARVDVAHCHGLYPSAHRGAGKIWDAINANVITALRTAREITVPSEWVADILRRDMGISPHVIGWAIEPSEWHAGENGGYVLWAKTRHDMVCDPTPLLKLAELRPDMQFVTTFGRGGANVKTTGVMSFQDMKGYVQNAAVYLATVHETFGIQTLEAMASGVPVLGYDYGGTSQIVTHGVDGYLVQPGDVEGLAAGLDYCLKYRDILGANAKRRAKDFTWDNVAAQFAAVYDKALESRNIVKCSVVIPYYNYGAYINEAVKSVVFQETNFTYEIIIVDDGSGIDHAEIASDTHAKWETQRRLRLLRKSNGGVASARNYGIQRANGEYIVCLDADDVLGSPDFLQTVVDALESDPTLGIAYTGLTLMTEDGTPAPTPHSFPPEFNFDDMANGRNCVPTCNAFRKEAWRRAGGYRKYLEPAEDANLWLRITALGYGAKKVTEAGMFHYRLHPNSLSSTVRTGGRKEPKWNDFAWVKDNQRPFAAPPVAKRVANPVRNYDRAQLAILIEVQDVSYYELQRLLDSIEAQSFRFWECWLVTRDDDIPLLGYAWVKQCRFEDAIQRIKTPLLMVIDSTEALPNDYISKALKAYQRTGERQLNSQAILTRTAEWFHPHEPLEPYAVIDSESLIDMLRVQYIGDSGMVIGLATHTVYGRRKTGDFFYVWTDDAQVMPDVFKPATQLAGIRKTPVPPKPKRVK